jgi:transcriptional regulator with XRE-family HTH domain
MDGGSSPPLRRRDTDKRFMGPLPDRIRHARRLCGISQAVLAERLGVGPSAVAQWEVPRGTHPTMQHLAHIATATEVSFEWLATGRGAPRAAPEPAAPAAPPPSGVVALDLLEERLLLAFRRSAQRRREALVRFLEDTC